MNTIRIFLDAYKVHKPNKNFAPVKNQTFR